MASVTVAGSAKAAFYSVKDPVIVAGNRRLPSICYEILESERRAIEGLAEKGAAVLYTEKVRFISGKSYSAAAAAEKASVQKPRVSDAVAAVEEVVTEKSAKKASKKTAGSAELSSSVPSEETSSDKEFFEGNA